MKSNTKGSTIIIVVFSVAIASILAGSVAALISTQRRIALRKELQIQAINVAEAAVDAAYNIVLEQVAGVGGSTTGSYIPTSGYNAVTLPAGTLSFLQGTTPTPTGYTAPANRVAYSDISVRVLPRTTNGTFYIDPADPANISDVNSGSWVDRDLYPIVATATATSGGVSYTAYVRKNIEARKVSMFQHAIFFQGQLQMHRKYPIMGPVHTNGTFILNAHNEDTAYYNGQITAAGRFYRGSTIDMGTNTANPYGYTPQDINGNLVASTVFNVGGVDRISLYTHTSQDKDGKDVYNSAYVNADVDSRSATWAADAIAKFQGKLKDKSMGALPFVPYGSAGYQLDDASTTDVNEFNNSTYKLIQPMLPSTHPAATSSEMKQNQLAYQAGLILRLEKNASYKAMNSGTELKDANGLNITSYTEAIKAGADNYNQFFVVKGYKKTINATTGAISYTAVDLPEGVIGQASYDASGNLTGVKTGVAGTPEAYRTNSTTTTTTTTTGTGKNKKTVTTTTTSDVTKVTSGFHNSRLGRGVVPLTLDMSKLKAVVEGTDGSASAAAFRSQMTISGASAEWNGTVYVEYPTSLNTASSSADDPINGAATNTKMSNGVSIDTVPFAYGSVETKHPDRWSDIDNESRADRTDSVVPIAPELRQYPSVSADGSTLTNGSGASGTASDIYNALYAIPGIQVINAKQLPNPTDAKGFTLATNAPVYIVGSYNSDGDVDTNTKLSSTKPGDYATNDTGEVPAGIFCDTLTFLSDEWKLKAQREASWKGNGDHGRVASTRIEISACIATGEYPIFEFFTNALQNFQALYDVKSPIVIKGSMVGMFKSEIQHIKQAYGRDKNLLIEKYYQAHGAFAIPSVRFHSYLAQGGRPPSAPFSMNFVPADYKILTKSDPSDKTQLTAAGF